MEQIEAGCKRIRNAGCAAACLVLPMLGGCSGKPSVTEKQTPLPIVDVALLSRTSMPQAVDAAGTLGPMPNKEVTLTSQVSGTLQVLDAAYGQSVRQGQVIAEIATPTAAGQVLSAQATLGQSETAVQQAQANALQQEVQSRVAVLEASANVRGAQATLAGDHATLIANQAAVANAEQNYARSQTLFAEGLIAQKDLDAAKLVVLTAKSQVNVQQQQIASQEQTVESLQQELEAAKAGTLMEVVKKKDILAAEQQEANSQAALEMARAQAALSTIRSPISGQVTEVGAAAGEAVDTTTKIAVIADFKQMQLSIAIPEAQLQQIRAGMTIRFTTDAAPGKVFSANLQTVSSQIDQTTGTATALAVVNNNSGLLKDNMTVTAQIAARPKQNVFTVPDTAIVNDADTGDKTVLGTTGPLDGKDIVLLGACGFTAGEALRAAAWTGARS